ncbi:hypothetical protein SKAU_G00106170 [Synaphobranchus kaupii]|uniref:Uncharacterized protein n=1 Tax=Synaphobranchus kaupii TaxID=118154 RepID=A0A9Q1G072_SYNKA|nr:hypothetical protein SKAU_G00106170 [Synaphobranchus kaupii]
MQTQESRKGSSGQEPAQQRQQSVCLPREARGGTNATRAPAPAPAVFDQGGDGRAVMEELEAWGFNRNTHCGITHIQGLRDKRIITRCSAYCLSPCAEVQVWLRSARQQHLRNIRAQKARSWNTSARRIGPADRAALQTHSGGPRGA